jgi:hypothetical protein
MLLPISAFFILFLFCADPLLEVIVLDGEGDLSWQKRLKITHETNAVSSLRTQHNLFYSGMIP